MSAVIEIRKRLSDAFILDAALSVPAGFTVLFGASGSGKTTILRAIAGLTRPDAGRIIVGGRTLFDREASVDVAPMTPAEAARCPDLMSGGLNP